MWLIGKKQSAAGGRFAVDLQLFHYFDEPAHRVFGHSPTGLSIS
jgi:hypothetical protein